MADEARTDLGPCGLCEATGPTVPVASRPLYTPTPARQAYDDQTCAHCGQGAEAHHSDGRCYTPEAMGNRLHFSQQTGRWPGPDEAGAPP
jgi:hypothetical protein